MEHKFEEYLFCQHIGADFPKKSSLRLTFPDNVLYYLRSKWTCLPW